MTEPFRPAAVAPHARPFTGRHMATILIAFFGVVIAVNFFMAYVAVSGFGGTVVDNSYVASQNYNRWLAEGRAQAALGWRIAVSRTDDGHVLARVTEVSGPWHGTVQGTARRAMGRSTESPVAFAALGNGEYRSVARVPTGRLIVLLHLQRAGSEFSSRVELP